MFVFNEIYSEKKRKKWLSLAPECTCSVCIIYYAEYIYHVNMLYIIQGTVVSS